jgi:hypothetical protein
MNNSPAPIIEYARRSGRLTLKEWREMAPLRFTLFVGVFVNWFLFFFISLLIGGDAIGITPSTQGFVVTDHGRFTSVTKGIWFFSLIYPAATLLITPLAFVLLVSSLLRGLFGDRAPYWRATFLFCLWYAPWAYAISRDTRISALDAWGLKSIWPVVSWLLIGIAIAMAVVIVIGARWEGKRSAALELRGDIEREMKRSEDLAQRREK